MGRIQHTVMFTNQCTKYTMNAILEVEYFFFNTKKNVDERSHVKVSPKY